MAPIYAFRCGQMANSKYIYILYINDESKDMRCGTRVEENIQNSDTQCLAAWMLHFKIHQRYIDCAQYTRFRFRYVYVTENTYSQFTTKPNRFGIFMEILTI